VKIDLLDLLRRTDGHIQRPAWAPDCFSSSE
jgi:hypothetical protein